MVQSSDIISFTNARPLSLSNILGAPKKVNIPNKTLATDSALF